MGIVPPGGDLPSTGHRHKSTPRRSPTWPPPSRPQKPIGIGGNLQRRIVGALRNEQHRCAVAGRRDTGEFAKRGLRGEGKRSRAIRHAPASVQRDALHVQRKWGWTLFHSKQLREPVILGGPLVRQLAAARRHPRQVIGAPAPCTPDPPAAADQPAGPCAGLQRGLPSDFRVYRPWLPLDYRRSHPPPSEQRPSRRSVRPGASAGRAVE